MKTVRDKTSPDSSKFRFAEPLKFLPVSFVSCVIFGLWLIYVILHCMPLVRDPHTSFEGYVLLGVFNLVVLLLVSCYIRSILQHPGTVPEYDEFATKSIEANMTEKKRLGEKRHCKWCDNYKPDRCHHCRVCRMCILKMDHHCPWIYNCVGFKNFKYFFLVVMYATVASHFITWTMIGSVLRVFRDVRTPFLEMFLVIFGETLSAFMGFLLTAFFCFHVYLLSKAMTTIEFCEKSRRPTFDNERYSRGPLGNVKAVLGDNVFLWFLPLSAPSGDGMSFTNEETPLQLAKDMDAGRGLRRKTHEKSLESRGQGRRNRPGTGSAPGSESDVEAEGGRSRNTEGAQSGSGGQAC